MDWLLKIYLNLSGHTGEDGYTFKNNEGKLFLETSNAPLETSNAPTRIIFRWFTNNNKIDSKLAQNLIPFCRRMKQLKKHERWFETCGLKNFL